MWRPVIENLPAILIGCGFVALLIFVITDKYRDYQKAASGRLTETLKGLSAVQESEIERLKRQQPARRRIILVDDDLSLAEILRVSLAREFDVQVYSNGLDALIEILHEYKGRRCYDLLILDYSMSFGGDAVIRMVRAAEATGFMGCYTPIAILSGFGPAVPKDTGADAIWNKPQDTVKLNRLANELIEDKGHQHF